MKEEITPKPGTVKGVEIFSAGTWNGDNYTVQDLEEMVRAFKETQGALQPYLKLGHSEDQKMLAADELPAAGWIKNLRLVGKKLVADFVDMPRKIYDLVKARAYKRVSSEIFVNADVNGKRYPFALKAVALLGGETPAVQNLDDVHALYALDAGVLAYAQQTEARRYSFESAEPHEEEEMPEKKPEAPAAPAAPAAEKDNALPPAPPAALHPAPGSAPAAAKPAAPAPHAEPDGDECMNQKCMARKQELEAMKQSAAKSAPELAESKRDAAAYKLQADTLRQELAQEREALAKERAELAQFRMNARRAEVKAEVDKFVADKKVLPAQAPLLTEILIAAKETGARKFSIGGKDFDSVEAMVKEFASLGGASLPTKPVTEQGQDIAVPSDEDGAAMDKKVRDYMAKNGVKSYREAYIEVAKELGKAEPKKG